MNNINIKFLLIFILFFAVSCDNTLTSANPVCEKGDASTVWICHNPESDFHGKVCTLKQDDPCLRKGDSTKFCWELEVEDCLSAENIENIEFCKELVKNEQ